MEVLKQLISQFVKTKNFESDIDFNKFSNLIFSKLCDNKLNLLKSIKKHHLNTFYHNFMVSYDVYIISNLLNYSNKKILSLTLAALFHDIGKLNIHNLILDLNYDEVRQIWIFSHKLEKPISSKISIENITLLDTINYFSLMTDDANEFKKNFIDWLKENNSVNFLNLSIREYLNQHQDFTNSILKEYGFNKKIIIYAASHHINYFSSYEKNNLPKECSIIRIADKFNAIIHSEGNRSYSVKKSRVEAIMIIINEFGDDLKNSTKLNKYRCEILRILAKRYLVADLNLLISKISQFRNEYHSFETKNILVSKNIYSLLKVELLNFILLNKYWPNIFKFVDNDEIKFAKKILLDFSFISNEKQ